MATSGSVDGNDVDGDGGVYLNWQLASQSVAGNYSTINWQCGWQFSAVGCRGLRLGSAVVNGTTVYNDADGGDGVHGYVSGHNHRPALQTASGSINISHGSDGTKTFSASAAMSGWAGGPVASSGSNSFALPDIVQTPTAPGAPTGSRINDGQIDLSWTNNSATHHEYASQSVQRSVDGGSYSTIATGLGSAATSYSDTTTSANHKYAYKIAATNAAGSATGSAGSAVYTTPGAPTIGTATKQPNSDVELSWTNNIGYGDTTYGTDIYESLDGGSFTYAASVSGGLTTWTDVAPDTSKTHAYKVLATKGALFSSLSSASNTVTLLSTAGAPTGLSPSGVARDAAGSIVLSWTHNPTDGTPQSKRHVQAKVNAGSYADLINDSSTTESYTVSAATWTNGDTITWKVATAGENGTLGSYSAESTITLSAVPTATINAPAATYDTSSLTVEWGYFQAQSSAQAAWQASLFDDADALIETISGTTEVECTFTHTVEDGATYTVTVTVTSAAGLVSTADSQEFTVVYSLPAAIAISGAFDNAAGFTVLTLTGQASSPGYSGLSLDGSGDWGSAADASALDIAGDIDMRADVQSTDWTPASQTGIIEKWGAGTNQRAYALVLDTAGKLRMRLSSDGTSGTIVEATSSVAVGVADGTRLSVRAARVGTTVTFYTSTDTDLSAATWTQLGTTQTLSGSFFASTDALRIGSNGASASFLGMVFSAQVRDSAGAIVAYPIYTAEAAGTTSFSDGYSNTWTLVGGATIVTVVPATEDIATVDVQRQIDGGAWVTILTGVVLDSTTHTATVQDTVPVTVGTNTYRAIAYSALPSSVMSATEDVVTSETTWGYLSGGDSFADVARFRATPTFAASTSRAKALYHFAGRPKAVQLAGEALTTTLSVSGKLSSGSGSAADFEALGLAEGVVCWRGPDGRRLFASLAKMDVGVTRANALTTVAFSLTEVDFTEGDQ